MPDEERITKNTKKCTIWGCYQLNGTDNHNPKCDLYICKHLRYTQSENYITMYICDVCGRIMSLMPINTKDGEWYDLSKFDYERIWSLIIILAKKDKGYEAHKIAESYRKTIEKIQYLKGR